MTLKKAVAGALLAFILVCFFELVPLVEGEFEFQTTYRITLHKDSSATWVVELSTALSSKEDLDSFIFFKDNADRNTLLSGFESTISSIVSRAASLTGRPMAAENFSLKIDVTGILKRLGVIQYRFKWVNFSLKTSDRIEVGDVFEGGFYLFADERLEIDYSELDQEYFLKLASPKPSNEDVLRVAWVGKLDFSDGEPRLIFQSRTIRVEEFSPESSRVKKDSMLSIQGRISPPTPGLTLRIIYLNPQGSETVREVTVGENGVFSDVFSMNTAGEWRVSLRLPSDSPYRFSPEPQPIQLSVYEESGSETQAESLPPVFFLALLVPPVVLLAIILFHRSRGGRLKPPDMQTLSDEDLVMKLLREAGGRLTQSQIKDAAKFSKSKTSIVLNELQRKGLIRKIKRGREYIVELV
ncbi:MAG: hypothetical protein FGF48_02020 [Candidatus Brockarchaeota archaeon]|nr:hypothetical protein [Candidatus Brockarchaeota archaeon]